MSEETKIKQGDTVDTLLITTERESLILIAPKNRDTGNVRRPLSAVRRPPSQSKCFIYSTIEIKVPLVLYATAVRSVSYTHLTLPTILRV